VNKDDFTANNDKTLKIEQKLSSEVLM